MRYTKVLELGLYKNKTTGSGNEYELDFEIKGTNQGLVEVFTYEVQHFPDIKFQDVAINMLLSIELNLNKLLTPEEVFAAAYEYEKMLETVDSRLQGQLGAIGNVSKGARALAETSILTYSFLFADSIQDPKLKELVKDILAAVERGEKNLSYYWSNLINYYNNNSNSIIIGGIILSIIIFILSKGKSDAVIIDGAPS